MFKLEDQTKLDRMRKTYKLYFPGDISEASISAFLKAISSATKGGAFFGRPTLAVEAWSTASGIEWLMKVPHDDGYIVSQLQAQIPGTRTEQLHDQPPRRLWTLAREFGVRRSERTLRTDPNTSTTLLSSMKVKQGETVMFQWVLSPALHRREPDNEQLSSSEMAERKTKMATPNFGATLRIAAVADDVPAARDLIAKVRKAFGSVNNGVTQFVPRPRTMQYLQRAIDRTSTPMLPGAQLSTPELASLLGWVVDRRQVPGLPPMLSRQIPPTQNIPTEGLVLGQAAVAGMERPVAIAWPDTAVHTAVVGASGTGKSELLTHMARQIMEAGYGLIMMETAGNLYDKVLDNIPPERIEDVVLLDVSDTAFPVAFNPLDQLPTNVAVDKIIELLVHLYDNGTGGTWINEYANYVLRTVAAAGLSLTEIRPLLDPRTPAEEAWAKSIVGDLKDEDLQAWWEKERRRNKDELLRRAEPTLGRTWQLTDRPELRHVFGQSESTVRIDEILRGNKILLVNLKGTGKAASLIAGILTEWIWLTVQGMQKDVPTFLMQDELSDFLNNVPQNTDELLAQARKHKLPLILATQYLGQLSTDVRRGVLTNAKNWVSFRANSDDATAIARQLSGEVAVDDLKGQPDYEAVAIIGTPGGKKEAVSIRTLAPVNRKSHAKDVLAFSRSRYAKPVAEVQQAIKERYKREPQRSKRPPISGSQQMSG